MLAYTCIALSIPQPIHVMPRVEVGRALIKLSLTVCDDSCDMLCAMEAVVSNKTMPSQLFSLIPCCITNRPVL